MYFVYDTSILSSLVEEEMMAILRHMDDEAVRMFMQYVREISTREFRGTIHARAQLLASNRCEVQIETINRNAQGQFTADQGSDVLTRVVERMKQTGYPLVEVEQ